MTTAREIMTGGAECAQVGESAELLGRHPALQLGVPAPRVGGEGGCDDLAHGLGCGLEDLGDVIRHLRPESGVGLLIEHLCVDLRDEQRVELAVVLEDAARQRLPGLVDDLPARAVQRLRAAQRDLERVGDVVVGVDDLDVDEPHHESGEDRQDDGQCDDGPAARAAGAACRHGFSVCSAWGVRR